MIARSLGSWLLLSLAFALGTWVGGWWAVPLLGGAWGLVQTRSLRRAPLAGLAGAGGWGILLGWQALRGPVGALAETIGPVVNLSGSQFFLLTLGFAAIVAWAAAATAGSLRDVTFGRVARAAPAG
ncbi:MAG: hypothetical protein ACOC8K_07445 [Gemmatimonadota bacterium]